MNSFSEAWNIICNYLKDKITDVAFDTWISRIEPVSLDFEKGQTRLLVPSEFHRETLQRCYMPLLNEAFSTVFGTTFEICLILPEEDEDKEEEKNNNTPTSIYEYTFQNFIVGSSNTFAHAAAMAVAANPANAYNPLMMYGSSGLGKTHLLYAIGNEIKKNDPDKKIQYVKGDDFMNELIESIGNNTTAEFRQKYRQADVLLVDDVQFIAGRDRTQEEFFHTFNTLYEARKQIVLTSDRPPKEIKILDDRLRSRFEWGLLADLQPPDIETRIAIIKKKANILELPLTNEQAEYIANKIKSNVRQLEGVVKKLNARYLLNNEKINQIVIAEVISDILNNEAPPEHTVEKIIEEVARTFGVDPEDIRSQKSRRANINHPRHIAIYISRELTDLSMVAIGEAFGNRHYSTIVYTIQQMEKKMQTNTKLKETVEDIIKNIRDR
ncbi:MAG: chromosomal replication initiator protein DnaA [Ruminococcus sp.]|nr:chromosomal replication initiator protein DnaA [Ruminococcus sp.]